MQWMYHFNLVRLESVSVICYINCMMVMRQDLSLLLNTICSLTTVIMKQCCRTSCVSDVRS